MRAHCICKLETIAIYIYSFACSSQGISTELARFFDTLVWSSLYFYLVFASDINANPSHYDDKTFSSILDSILE